MNRKENLRSYDCKKKKKKKKKKKTGCLHVLLVLDGLD